ncbi:hypothetical protein ACFQ4M_18145 [Thauera mechernichensis]|uniref:Secreted protein n=1 Tax=Thauera mechernichensis TaxID=82788 RepID=A0ABW3WI58_9RHOO|nr:MULTISPECIES: hypothetical protein [Thauera]ENO82845.1 hypothetical protein B447_02471 [Thauera sp. 27]ENO93740.1 hypothetical protein C662_06292 [Thauera sp. 28]MDG3065274.1 hypothetical protein [Thauera mechernichensis]WBL64359.1 hypothetical protein LQF09_00600 [Thauera sp. WB-2]HAG76270.1 hypothetical protein [Thauera sp.]
MIRLSTIAIATLPLLLSACFSSVRPSPVAQLPDAGPAHRNGQLDFALASGDYGCEHGVRVQVRRDMQERINNRIQLGWNGNQYLLERDLSHSGLPRFEDPASGLVWIDLPWKSVLLDGRSHKPIASECRQVPVRVANSG